MKYDWKKLSEDSELQQRYTIAVKKRYQTLAEDRNGEKYDKYIEANRAATEECIPKRTKAKKTLRSSDVRVEEARQDAQQSQNQLAASNLEKIR